MIVDSHVSVSQLVSMLLARDSRFTVLAEAASGTDALRLFRKYHPSLVISELDLPGLRGPELFRSIREIDPKTRFLFYFGSENLPLLSECMASRPHGFVHKSEDVTVLRQGIDVIAQGMSFTSQRSLELLATIPSTTSPDALTRKERTILQLIAEGRSTKQMAVDLEHSPKTIEHYRRGLMQKLGLDSVAALTLYAVRNGLVKP